MIRALAVWVVAILVMPVVLLADCSPSTHPPAFTAARGRLVSFENQPMSSAQMHFFTATKPAPRASWKVASKPISVSTDSDGSFDLSSLPEGMYFLEVMQKPNPGTKARRPERHLVQVLPRSADRAKEIKLRMMHDECMPILASETVSK